MNDTKFSAVDATGCATCWLSLLKARNRCSRLPETRGADAGIGFDFGLGFAFALALVGIGAGNGSGPWWLGAGTDDELLPEVAREVFAPLLLLLLLLLLLTPRLGPTQSAVAIDDDALVDLNDGR